MLRDIERFLNDLFDANADGQETAGPEELRVATAALLVHCAKADGDKTADEDVRLRSILRDEFGLSDTDIGQVIAAAEAQERDAVDLHKFTRILHRNLDRDGRMKVVGQLWEIAHADGTIDAAERTMVSLAAQLLDVEIRDSVALRRTAERNPRN